MNKIYIIVMLLIAFASKSNAQTAPFQIVLEPMNIIGLGGLQAFAWGQHDGKWLIIGGRLDGLHRRQPFAAFDAAGHNNQLIVVDPIAQQKWSAPLSSLPIGLQEQLSSTNMEFFQQGDYLYLAGGYGYGHAKQELHTILDRFIAPYRDAYTALSELSDEELFEPVRRGNAIMQARLDEVMKRVAGYV